MREKRTVNSIANLEVTLYPSTYGHGLRRGGVPTNSTKGRHEDFLVAIW
jgi:hypothetical protein